MPCCMTSILPLNGSFFFFLFPTSAWVWLTSDTLDSLYKLQEWFIGNTKQNADSACRAIEPTLAKAKPIDIVRADLLSVCYLLQLECCCMGTDIRWKLLLARPSRRCTEWQESRQRKKTGSFTKERQSNTMSGGLFLQIKFEKKMSPFFHIVEIHTLKKERAQQMCRKCPPMVWEMWPCACLNSQTQTHTRSLSPVI